MLILRAIFSFRIAIECAIVYAIEPRASIVQFISDVQMARGVADRDAIRRLAICSDAPPIMFAAARRCCFSAIERYCHEALIAAAHAAAADAAAEAAAYAIRRAAAHDR